jgi:glycosyltransferase involved in cell wall biosynthesis
LEAHVALVTDVPHDEVAAFVRRADVFVLSSRWRKGEFGEGLPLVLAEAGALAKPIVSTRSTGCDEIIVDGETGRLVELENVPQLAQAILDQLNDPENAQRMGKNLQKRVAERFTWKEAWRKYRSLFEES